MEELLLIDINKIIALHKIKRWIEVYDDKTDKLTYYYTVGFIVKDKDFHIERILSDIEYLDGCLGIKFSSECMAKKCVKKLKNEFNVLFIK